MWDLVVSPLPKIYVPPEQVPPGMKAPLTYHIFLYTSHTLPKLLELGDAGETNPYHLFFYMLARFRFVDMESNEIVFVYPNKRNDVLPERALSCLPPRFHRELVPRTGYEIIEFPLLQTGPESIHDTWAYSYVRNLYSHIWNSVPRVKGKYTFLTRNTSHVKVRRCRNEEDLRKPLQHLGFSLYTMDFLTFEEQIRLFRSSEVIVGLHGAAFSFLIFCDPGTKVVEINPYEHKGHFEHLSHHMNLSYTRYTDVVLHEANDPSHADCTIPVETFVQNLERILHPDTSI